MAEVRSNRRWGWIMGISLVVAVAVGLLGARWLNPDCEDGACPSVEELRSYRPPEPPQIFGADGELVGQLSGPRRTVVPLDSIPEVIREGYIAVEDRRFREHGGVDFTGGFRALVRNIRASGVQEGASTITMQLARNLFGPEVLDWNKWHRKLAEFRLAREIEGQLAKDQILEMYLNQIYLGDGVYGVGTAAQHYFGKHVSEVGPREAAFLVGLAKNPEGYDPDRNPELAAERIATVLDVLERDGVMTAEEAQQARESELELAEAQAGTGWGANAYYISAVRRQLRDIYPNPADRQGMRVHTGLDPEAQASAVESLVGQIRDIESGRWGTFRHEAAGGDMERVQGSHSPYLQGMVLVMKPDDGLVTTLVGGRDYEHSEFDRAFQAKRQPGSAFKPIVYAAAIGRGLKLYQTISTEPVRFAQQGSDDWQPSDHVSGQEMTVREALVHSSNTAAVRVGQRIGTAAVASQARAMGIESELPPYPSMYLGAGEVTPAELVSAYATFVNGGHTVEPYFITRIEDGHGREVYRHTPSGGQRAIDSRVAFLVLDMMRDVATRGTGWRVGRSVSFPVAGKTGTTNESRDVWFVGATPALVGGVWLGFDKPQTIVHSGAGGTLAAPVWAKVMQAANEGLGPLQDWQPPSGITQARVGTGPGLGGFAIPEDCALPAGVTVRNEYFISGSEPAEYCPFDRGPYGGGRERYGYGWPDDTVSWDARVRDSLDRERGDRGRTIFWDGDDAEDGAARRRRMEEREERLDSLEAVRQRAMERVESRRGRDRDDDSRDGARRDGMDRRLTDTIRIGGDTGEGGTERGGGDTSGTGGAAGADTGSGAGTGAGTGADTGTDTGTSTGADGGARTGAGAGAGGSGSGGSTGADTSGTSAGTSAGSGGSASTGGATRGGGGSSGGGSASTGGATGRDATTSGDGSTGADTVTGGGGAGLLR